VKGAQTGRRGGVGEHARTSGAGRWRRAERRPGQGWGRHGGDAQLPGGWLLSRPAGQARFRRGPGAGCAA